MNCVNCEATLLKGQVFVPPVAELAKAGKKGVADLTADDLTVLAICQGCATVLRADGEKWELLEDVAATVRQAREERADKAAAEILRRVEQSRRDRAAAEARQEAAKRVASRHALGAALLSVGFNPTERILGRRRAA